MLCLSDTDLIIKLSALDIIEEALSAFEVQRKDVRVTPEIVPYLEGRAFTKHPGDVVRRAIKFTKGLRQVPDVEPADVALLRRVPGIDYGEQILFASTANLGGAYFLATGDKKSLRALAAAPRCDHIRDRLRRKVLCLEHLVLGAIDGQGFKWVYKRAAPACACDECLVHAFANGQGNVDEPTCKKWLAHFLTKLRGETGELLYEPEPAHAA